MLKIKKQLTNLKSAILKIRKKRGSLKAKIIIGIISLIIILTLYLIFSLLFIGRERIILAKLRNSYNFEIICHEDCRLRRELEINKLINLLKQKNKKLEEQIKNIILNEEEEIELRQELIKILSQVNDTENIPEYLKLYLEDSSAEVALQTTIINSFAVEANEEAEIKYYFNLLAGEADLNLKLEVIRSLSNFENKKKLFSKTQLELISKLALEQNTSKNLRAPLILLLSDYYPLFPNETKKILTQVYNNKNTDKISRIFAADTINRYLKNNKLTVPEASNEEWNNYYNN